MGAGEQELLALYRLCVSRPGLLDSLFRVPLSVRGCWQLAPAGVKTKHAKHAMVAGGAFLAARL